ncbi:electron transfer flavoprotein subunit beta/FixA family protein [bacterium]|nr:electron transfer flavoprotein subunit beta/FixA family protein [bacterium]
MKFVVCIKEVPDTIEVKMDPVRNTLIRTDVPSIINPFDAFALELALQKKDINPDIEITTLSMGPPQAEKSLRKTIAMGADNAILISDIAFAGSDTWATSMALSTAIKKIGSVDLVFAGQQAIDGDTAQVGPEIAEFLSLPQAIFIRDLNFDGENKIIVERITETGYEILDILLPALVSVIKLPRDPRLPSLRGMMKSKRAEIIKWNASDLDLDAKTLGLDGSPTKVIKIFTPEKRVGGELWDYEPKKTAARLADLLKEKRII